MFVQKLFQKKAIPFYLLAVIIVVLIVLLISPQVPGGITDNQAIPSPTPISSRDLESDPDGLIHTPNPTYETKVRQEPFWTKLPYWTDHYKIEYKDSNDLLLISLFLPSHSNNAQSETLYKNEAFTWLRANGGKPELLRIEYRSIQE